MFQAIPLICLFSFSSFSVLNLVGEYVGQEWGYFRFMGECNVNISLVEGYSGLRYSLKLTSKNYQAKIIIDKFEVDKIDDELSEINIEPDNDVNESFTQRGGTIMFKNGAIDQVYLWETFCFIPTFSFNCASFEKI